MAISEALLVAPERTLREFGYMLACSRLGFDDLEFLTRDQVNRLIAKRAKALTRIPANRLTDEKARCLAHIREQQQGRNYPKMTSMPQNNRMQLTRSARCEIGSRRPRS